MSDLALARPGNREYRDLFAHSRGQEKPQVWAKRPPSPALPDLCLGRTPFDSEADPIPPQDSVKSDRTRRAKPRSLEDLVSSLTFADENA